MDIDLSNPTSLREEDFRRLGLPRYECRLEVIRRAATRRAAVHARRQLRSPSWQDHDQLSRLATSTYRLLDPRQRDHIGQRVHIGRIGPEELIEGARRFERHSVTECERSAMTQPPSAQTPAGAAGLDFGKASCGGGVPLSAPQDRDGARDCLHAGDFLQARVPPRERRGMGPDAQRQIRSPGALVLLAMIVLAAIMGWFAL